ncbi:MAG: biotin transporter BioY [Propionibacteriaceae bacterium]|jgi:biotin transport system substrate-specific component|nr:biotin transporter BioY [Propionibacteriaceae bacterium]
MRSKDIALIALFAALTCVLGLTPVIPLPVLGVTFSLQTLGMILAGVVLGAKRGALAMLLVIVLVAIGLPVLTGGQGGIAKLVGPTAGFVWSWPIGALIAGGLVERWWAHLNLAKALVAALLGSLSLYVLGQVWLAWSLHIPASVASWSWLVYVPGDLVKSIVAALVAVTVKKAYPLITARRDTTSADAAKPQGDTASSDTDQLWSGTASTPVTVAANAESSPAS